MRALMTAGLYDDALREVQFAQRTWEDSSVLQATSAWIRAQQAQELRADERFAALRGSITIMRRAYPQFLAAEGQTLPLEVLRIIFPLDYWDLIEKYSKLKSATAAIIRRREDLDERVKKAHAELVQTEAELNVAVETNQDDLAVILIQKKNQLTALLAELKTDAETAQRDADGAKAALIGVQGDIRKLKAERDTMLARMQSAQARMRIQEQLEGLSVDAEVKALDNVREHIKNTIAEANLGQELADSSLDTRLAALRTQAGDVAAKQQLAELKAKRAAQQAAAPQKTM